MAKITPSSCLLIHSQTSVCETIQRMISDNSSYVLVENSREEIVGIFTDHDVMKSFFKLRDEVLISPITAVMQSPVQMLPLELIHKAPSLMAKLGIGHVPVYEQLEEKRNIVGIVTLKSLAAENLFTKEFEELLGAQNFNTSEPTAQRVPDESYHLEQSANSDLTDRATAAHAEVEAKGTRIKIGVLSFDGSLLRSLSAVYSKIDATLLSQIDYQVLNQKGLLNKELEIYDALAIDIDRIDGSLWAKILGHVNHMEAGPVVFLTLNVQKHDPEAVKTLHLIERGGWLHVYSKPVDLFKFAGEFLAAAKLNIEIQGRHNFK